MSKSEYESDLSKAIETAVIRLLAESPEPLAYLAKLEQDFASMMGSELNPEIGSLSDPALAAEVGRILSALLPKLRARFEQQDPETH